MGDDDRDAEVAAAGGDVRDGATQRCWGRNRVARTKATRPSNTSVSVSTTGRDRLRRLKLSCMLQHHASCDRGRYEVGGERQAHGYALMTPWRGVAVLN